MIGTEVASALPKFSAASDRLSDARVTGLGDTGPVRAWTAATAPCRAVAAGLTSATLPGTLERDQGAVAVLRHQRWPPADSGLLMPVASSGSADSAAATALPPAASPDRGSTWRRRFGLDQHGLGIGVVLRGLGRLQHALGLPGLPGVVLLAGCRAHRVARHEDATTSSSQPSTAVLRCRALQPATLSVTGVL